MIARRLPYQASQGHGPEGLEDPLEGNRRLCHRAFAAGPGCDGQDAQMGDPAAADPGVLARAPKILKVPCALNVNRQVFGLSFGVPVPLECLTLNVPAGKTHLSVVLLIKWPTPGAVKTPKATISIVLEVAEVLTDWKCSVPETAGPAAGDAPAGTASHTAAAAAAAAAVAKATILFNCFPSPNRGIYHDCDGCGGPWPGMLPGVFAVLLQTLKASVCVATAVRIRGSVRSGRGTRR